MTSPAEKRAAAQKAEADFFVLLKESGIAKPGAIWKEVRLRLILHGKRGSIVKRGLLGEAKNRR